MPFPPTIQYASLAWVASLEGAAVGTVGEGRGAGEVVGGGPGALGVEPDIAVSAGGGASLQADRRNSTTIPRVARLPGQVKIRTVWRSLHCIEATFVNHLLRGLAF